jgi:hypothetical protein
MIANDTAVMYNGIKGYVVGNRMLKEELYYIITPGCFYNTPLHFSIEIPSVNVVEITDDPKETARLQSEYGVYS